MSEFEFNFLSWWSDFECSNIKDCFSCWSKSKVIVLLKLFSSHPLQALHQWTSRCSDLFTCSTLLYGQLWSAWALDIRLACDPAYSVKWLQLEVALEHVGKIYWSFRLLSWRNSEMLHGWGCFLKWLKRMLHCWGCFVEWWEYKHSNSWWVWPATPWEQSFAWTGGFQGRKQHMFGLWLLSCARAHGAQFRVLERIAPSLLPGMFRFMTSTPPSLMP